MVATVAAARALPSDYERLLNHYCSAEDLEKVESNLEHPSGELPAPFNQLPKFLTAGLTKKWSTFQDGYQQIVGVSGKTMDCGATNFQPAQGGINDVRATEVAILQHIIGEFRGMITEQYWNDGSSLEL